MNGISQIATQLPRSEAARPNPVTALLERADVVLVAALGSQSSFVARIRALRRRLENENLQLAVLGQFKRGKSTFINALLGADLLPTGVIPLTAVATFVAWRPEPLVVVHFKGESRDEEFYAQTPDAIRDVLFRFVAEEANPENRVGVERVELFYPADILIDGTVIIDTPGVGSTLQHNTQAALRVLPESDVAFFVISADPPITEVELDYLRRLKSKTTRVFFVLNKADSLQSDDRRSVMEFLQKVLAQKSFIETPEMIFCVSARDGLAAKQNGDDQALRMSGIPELEDHLVQTLASEKIHWLREAVRRNAADILKLASTELRLRTRALNMPVEELAAKSDEFGRALLAIEEQRRITCDLLDGDHRRLREALDSRIDNLRKETTKKHDDVINASLSGAVPMAWEEEARRSLSRSMHDEFEAAREPLVSAFAADAGAALRACQDRVNALVGCVRQTAAEIFSIPVRPDTEHETFELGEDPYWVTEDPSPTLIPDASRLIDRLLPASLRRQRLHARMMRQAEELVIRNGENLRWAILLGLDETFRNAIAQFEVRLDEAIAATRNVIRDALTRRRDEAFSVQPELDRIAAASTQLAVLQEELQSDSPAKLADARRSQS
jgi:GTP-binding protein EngB required for normal cell division